MVRGGIHRTNVVEILISHLLSKYSQFRSLAKQYFVSNHSQFKSLLLEDACERVALGVAVKQFKSIKENLDDVGAFEYS